MTQMTAQDQAQFRSAMTLFTKDGEQGKAVNLLQDLAKRYPDFAPVHNNLGAMLRKLDQLDAAEHHYRKALSAAPDHGEAAYNYGNLLRDQKRYAEARQQYQSAIRLHPDNGSAWTNYGCLLRDMELFAESRLALKEAVKLKTDDPDTHNNLAVTLWKLKLFDAANAHYCRALALSPNDSRFLSNYGVCLMEVERYEEAETCFRTALEQDPDHLDTRGFLGQCLTGIGRFDEALDVFAKVHDAHPDHLDSNLGRARALLLKGDLGVGWEAYAWRWKRMEYDGEEPNNRWRGEDITGKSLHLTAEQGVGDILQFLRYVPLLEAKGASVSVGVPNSVRRIAATISPTARIISDAQPVPRSDYTCPLLDVPEFMDIHLDRIPADVPYLSLPEEVSRPLLKQKGARKHVGMVWAGNPEHKRDRQRSVPLEKMVDLMHLDGIAWYSLQKGDRTTDRRRLGIENIFPDIVAEAEDFADTAALIQQLDLVVTVDTSVAHLAAALGHPVWVLIQYAPDWRWLLDRNDTPWYPSMRLFRMGRHQDLSELKAALTDWGRQD